MLFLAIFGGALSVAGGVCSSQTVVAASVFLLGMFVVMITSFANGDPKKLMNGIDSRGCELSVFCNAFSQQS
mgnify:CR=1 FL=1